MQPFGQAIAGSWKNWCSVADKYSTISLYGHPCYPTPSGDLSPSGLWVIFLAVVLIIPIFQCYWVLEYLFCVAGFLTNSLPFPHICFWLACFSFCYLSSACPMCKQARTRLYTIFRWSTVSCPICLISTCNSSIFVTPCTDLASPSIKFLFLFSNLLLFLASPLRAGFPQWTLGEGTSSISLTMLSSLQYCYSATEISSHLLLSISNVYKMQAFPSCPWRSPVTAVSLELTNMLSWL